MRDIMCEVLAIRHLFFDPMLLYASYYCSLLAVSDADPRSLLILFLLFLGQNSRLRHFKSDWEEIWQDCSSSQLRSSKF